MQRDLFGIFRPVVSKDIDSLPDPSFRDWARKKLKEGTINDILTDLVRSGAAINTVDALNLLNSHSVSRRLLKIKPIITLTDLGLRPVKKFRTNTRGFPRNDKNSSCAYLGVLSHVLMNRFCKGQSHNLAFLNLQLPASPELERSEPLFDYQHRNPEQLKLLDFKDDFTNDLSESNLADLVKDLWDQASKAMGVDVHNFVESYYCSARFAEPLLNLVRVFAGVSVRTAFYNADTYERWLWINAMLTWANAFISLAEGKLPCPTIYEIQALNRCLGMSGGRIDGVEIVFEDKQPSFLIENASFDSIGQIAGYLQNTGNRGALRIIDWKFAIGDAVRVGGQFQRPMSPDEVKEKPIESHRMQIERYLTLGFLDELFAYQGGFSFSGSSDFWNRGTSIREGLIVYLFPTSPPIIHKVALTAEERHEVFVRDVVSNWEKTGPRSLTRGIDRQCRLLLSGRRDNGADRVSASDNDLIGGKDNALTPIIKVVNNHRTFLDSNKIIENRNGKYFLHLDRLIACIESGVVKTSFSFGLPQGGLICCPIHEDRTPSLSVKPQDGYFYCFARSCKISGRLLPRSIPQETQADVKPELWIRRKDLFKELFVPDEHHDILEQSHLSLQGQFYDSEGEHYVRKQRGLDPDLAYKMGAGFGNSKVISALLDQGISLGELKKVGLVRFSSKVSSRRGLCPMLSGRGLKLAEIKREIGKTADGQSVVGFPYFVLDGRITFPLKVRNRYANIYGRSVCSDAKVPHIKLSTRDSGIRHGAFNEEILYSDKCKEVTVTEGVFDAISIKQMFSRDALAIIGTKNDLVVELLAQSGKDVAIALDNDPAGRADTERLKKSFLRSRKFGGRVKDFTQSFIEGLYGRELEVRCSKQADWRDLLDWDDWNTLLIKHG